MNNKIPVWILIITFFLVVPALAKQKQESAQQPLTTAEIVAKMKTQLELTDQEVVDVTPIIENYLAQEKQLKLDEKKQLSKVLTSDQMYAWNFLQNEPPREKKKKGGI